MSQQLKGKDSPKFIDRTGLQNKNRFGEIMTIIAYKGANDIDIQFEDGTIIYNRTFKNFNKGAIAKPIGDRIGETSLSKKGEIVKIIAYRKSDDLDVEFPDGTVYKNANYHTFINCKLIKPESKLGQKSINNEGYEMEIIGYTSATNITIKFSDGNIISDVAYRPFKLGCVSNPYHKSVCNIGYFGVGDYKAKIDGKMTKSYSIWSGMIRRCYDEKTYKKQPTYKNVIVWEGWHNYQVFAEWVEKNWKPYMDKTWDLDKDIICPDCKIYSPETCAFVPHEINNSILGKTMGDKKVTGISIHCGKYCVRAPSLNGRKVIGRYLDRKIAENMYKKAREKYIKELADKWKYKITEQVYSAMYSWQI